MLTTGERFGLFAAAVHSNDNRDACKNNHLIACENRFCTNNNRNGMSRLQPSFIEPGLRHQRVLMHAARKQRFRTHGRTCCPLHPEIRRDSSLTGDAFEFRSNLARLFHMALPIGTQSYAQADNREDTETNRSCANRSPAAPHPFCGKPARRTGSRHLSKSAGRHRAAAPGVACG